MIVLLAGSSALAQTITVAAGGDLQLGPTTSPAVFEGIRALLQGDLRVVNLEGPITERGREVLGEEPRFAAPPKVAERLMGLVDAVALSNNHVMDQGANGLEDTRHFLEQHRIAFAPDTVRGVRLYEAKVPDGKGPSLVSIHWRHTSSLLPSDEERALAHAMIDGGASAVLGTGPHVPRGIEFYHRGVIAYSLGNLAFSCDCTTERDAYVLRFSLAPDGAVSHVEAIPIRAGLRAPPVRGDPGLAELLKELSVDLGSPARVDRDLVRFGD